jgi:hypothetical protein
MEPQSKGVIALRWLGFVPGAFIAAWLAWLLIFFGNKVSMWMMGINPDGFINKLFIEVISNGAMGAAFVYIGSRIAPVNRKVVAYILAVIAMLIAGFLAFPAIVQQNWWAVVGVIAMAGGAGLVVYQVAEGELDLDTHRLT